MRLIESLICCALLAMFASSSSGIIFNCARNYLKIQEKQECLDRDKFIAEGFLKLCNEKKDDELKSALLDWKKMCLSFWTLDFLKIYKSENSIFETWGFNGKSVTVRFVIEEIK